ncbi:hypothetical protein MPDQ_003820 [Monascus purpureus]|uniref:C2H2-type domain-containing protein n=1 Tax=Monascus purpureus TaxID=5098 RepID=A0A507R208_MONPU|nr:hypothetical protein MPDQ_003820 [Monascus purpureus]BDD59788.1 hypothetical protein MAP00_004977 [Monascus purpureus]
MGDGSDYPSPRSEGPGGPTSVLVATHDSFPHVPKMAEQISPSFVESARPRLSVRRARDPPKNTAGQIYCDHPDCQPTPPIFRRPCEWNKHMDKHDRPYKCLEPGCAKIQGFTYSGGLLRHQREVHKKNIKKPLMCPYADCNRSTGTGFTRQENLKEHLRRRHMHTENGASSELTIIPHAELDGIRASSLAASTGSKRKRDSVGDASGVIHAEDENGVDLRNELKRLRHEVEEKDRRLEELERIVAGLQQAIPQTATSQG